MLFSLQLFGVFFFAIQFLRTLLHNNAACENGEDCVSIMGRESFYFHLIVAHVAIGMSTMALMFYAIMPARAVELSLMLYCPIRDYRSRIPFAVSTIATASVALKEHISGVAFLAYRMVALSAVWVLLWFLAVAYVSAAGYFRSCDEQVEDEDGGEPTNNCSVPWSGVFLYIYFLVSLYWTAQVLRYLFYTTVAGVVGHWWSATPNSVGGSLCLASTCNLGSIALGAIVIAPVQTFRWIDQCSRPRGNDGPDDDCWHDDAVPEFLDEVRPPSTPKCCFLLGSCADPIDQAVEFINKWAFGT
jgi:hypothetical protein